jgi:spermidine synthase
MEHKNMQEINGDLWLTEQERDNLRIGYRIKEIISQEKSLFQEVAIVESYDFGRMLTLDGVVQTTAADGHIYNEMIIHIPLCTHPNPKKVLIIGGGDCGAAREAAKHAGVERIDMVEIDEVVVKQCKKHLQEISGNLSDPRVNFIFDDGIKHVKNAHNEYDVVVIDSSDPIGPAVPLFEKEFYAGVHRALKEDGLMVCQSQSPIMHMHILRNTVNSIRELFPIQKTYIATVPTYPGGMWSFTLGSKKYNETDTSKIPGDTKYVNEGILSACFQLPESIKSQLNG